MKAKEFKEIKNKDLKSLVKLAAEKKAQLLKVKLEQVTGGEKNLKSGLNLRREIAKILTLIKEKQIIEKLEEKKGEKVK